MPHRAPTVPPLSETRLSHLTPEARAEILAFLERLGIAPLIHRRTGEMMVPLEQMCRAMDMSPDEVRRAIADDPDCLETGDPDDLVPLQ